MRDIAFVHKKQKLDKEGRMQTIKVTIDSYNVYTCVPHFKLCITYTGVIITF